MALYTRLLSRQLGVRLAGAYRTTIPFQNIGIRLVSLKPIKDPYDDVKGLNHDEKNMKLKRPMSPHLEIYKPQLTSMMSITHRIMGVVLTTYTITIGVCALVLPHDFSYYLDAIAALGLPDMVIGAGKFAAAFPFVYHLFNGIRHLFWDLGVNLSIGKVYMTGYIVLACAFLGTTGLMFV